MKLACQVLHGHFEPVYLKMMMKNIASWDNLALPKVFLWVDKSEKLFVTKEVMYCQSYYKYAVILCVLQSANTKLQSANKFLHNSKTCANTIYKFLSFFWWNFAEIAEFYYTL